MNTVRNSCLAGTLGDPPDEGSMNLDGRDPGIPERLRQHEGRSAVPHTKVEHLADGIAARNRFQRTQRSGVVARGALRQRPEHLVQDIFYRHGLR